MIVLQPVPTTQGTWVLAFFSAGSSVPSFMASSKSRPLNSLCPSRTETEESNSTRLGGKDQHDPPGQHVDDRKMAPSHIKMHRKFHPSVYMDKAQHHEMSRTFSNRYGFACDDNPADYASSNYHQSPMSSNEEYIVDRNYDTTSYQNQNHRLGQQR